MLRDHKPTYKKILDSEVRIEFNELQSSIPPQVDRNSLSDKRGEEFPYMATGPYAPPVETDAPLHGMRHRVCGIAFVLSSLVTCLMAVQTAFLVFQVFRIRSDFEFSWQQLPPYILLLPVVSLSGFAILAYSSMQWRKCSVRRAIISLVGSMIVCYGLPFLLLWMLS